MDLPLTKQKCVPCEGGVPPISRPRAEELLAQTPGWSLDAEAKKISRKFKFKDFAAAMVFVNKVGDIAEAEGHHPDFSIHWNRVDLDIWTHAIGGLFINDFILAAKINEI
ncbi:4a-hydroxytetrahydrobiopterin dehydratase [Candidatus Uhrbacteria bacterium]|nr:4a-hydroxytetrahydrobiopterin dehydratase [Candidatus Uhrbacteria bacterium]